MSSWYLFRNGQTHGPYPEAMIGEWIGAGQLLPEEKLCREGDENWTSADMLPEFAPLFATARPPGSAPLPPTAGAYGVPTAAPSMAPGQKDRTVAGVLAILLGWLGVHHFYLGNTTIGIIYLVIALFTCTSATILLGIIDGIIYLTKPEDQFQRNYHRWFCNGT